MNTITKELTPRAWVGCLGCYNNGALFGKWIEGVNASDLTGNGLATLENIGGYIAPRCVKCFGDEFWVFDHENYLGLIEGECSPSEAEEAADTIEAMPEEEREAFGEYVAHVGSATYEQFEEANCGQWDSEEAFAEDLLASTGDLDPNSFLARYFDLEAFARDLFYDYFITDSGHVFRNN